MRHKDTLTQPFCVKRHSHGDNEWIDVWLGPIDHPEGEIIFKNLDIYYVSALIAILRKVQDNQE